MKPQEKPSHQQTRDYMAKRRQEKTPPPSSEQIRRELGWHMLQCAVPGNAR